jgi:hypothetical protein
MYMETWRGERRKPVRTARSPKKPVNLLKTTESEIISTPVRKLIK